MSGRLGRSRTGRGLSELHSRVQLLATPWTVVCQSPLVHAMLQQEYWNGLPFLPPGDLSDPGIKPRSPALKGLDKGN